MQTLRCLALWLALGAAALAAQIPAKPDKYFNDYARMVSPQTAARLNLTLEDFEKQTFSQLLVVIYPKLPDNSALEDFTIRAAELWKPGQAGKDNGAILFIFRDDRKMRIEVGYGLEGAIPDALAGRIVAEQIRPRFQAGDFEGGIVAGVNGLIQAARGEYRGTGTTVASRRNRGRSNIALWLVPVLIIIMFAAASRSHRRGTMYHRRRRDFWGGWGGWGGGWSGGGGGGGWDGDGSFSGGGGGFGGGGASGSW